MTSVVSSSMSRRSRSRSTHRKRNSDTSEMIAPAMDEEANATPAPTDPQLALLCLDYLRQIRRNIHHNSGDKAKGSFQEDYLTLAIFALSRSFTGPRELVLDEEEGSFIGSTKSDQLFDYGNDPWFQKELSLAAATTAYKNSIGIGVSKSTSNDGVTNASINDASSVLGVNGSIVGGNVVGKLTSKISIPTLQQMENEILYQQKPPSLLSPKRNNNNNNINGSSRENDDGENPMKWYEYDNSHYSNQQRFYPHDGLASTPLHLPDLIHTACDALGAKSRIEGEKVMVKDAMFHDFVDAVKSKGFFNINETDVFAHVGKKKKKSKRDDDTHSVGGGMIYNKKQMDVVKNQIYQDRYRKVVDKYRFKLEEKMVQEERDQIEESKARAKAKAQAKADAKAAKAEAAEAEARAEAKTRARLDEVFDEVDDEARDQTRDESALSADDEITVSGSVYADKPMKYRRNQNQRSSSNMKGRLNDKIFLEEIGEREYEDASTASTAASSMKSSKSTKSSSRRSISSSSRASINRKDIEEAERLKAAGNVFMQQKKYAQARNSYTSALAKAPNGPTSHVYYSNRAAALLSMRNFTEAVWDAEKSIALKPDYPKAHARLGLAHFLLGQFQEAVESYSLAVKYEPSNQTSISYLERSRRKLAAVAQTDTASLSVVYDDDNRKHHEDEDFDARSRRSMRSADGTRNSTSRRRQTIGGDVSTTSSLRSSRSRSRRRKTSASGPLSKHLESLEDDAERKISSMKKGDSSVLTSRTSSDMLSEDPFPLDEYDRDDKDPGRSSMSEKCKEADRIKIQGNKAMARKEYADAIKLYSKALKLAPAGPSSHIYFSNRAAALCYMERYEEAELDSERALALNPEFGKAHARLGLSRYFLRDYDGAVDAYETALLYDPDNESNRIYLAKAKLKLSRRKSTRISGE